MDDATNPEDPMDTSDDYSENVGRRAVIAELRTWRDERRLKMRGEKGPTWSGQKYELSVLEAKLDKLDAETGRPFPEGPGRNCLGTGVTDWLDSTRNQNAEAIARATLSERPDGEEGGR